MLKEEIEQVEAIARMIAKEEIALAIKEEKDKAGYKEIPETDKEVKE